jgi:hypothetical protein
MFVSRSDVSFLASIQRESCATEAKAMSASLAGSGASAAVERTKCSLVATAGSFEVSGCQTVAGARVSSSASLRGPVRRSNSAASDVRQLFAAISRCAGVIVTCISFSASAKVAGEISGPTGGAVLNAGGAPGVAGVPVVGVPAVGCTPELLHAARVAARPSGASRRKVRRVVTGACAKGRRRTAILSPLRVVHSGRIRVRLRPRGPGPARHHRAASVRCRSSN